MRRFIALVAAVGLSFIAASAVAETKVTVSGTHLCCGQCLKAVDATLKDMPGVKYQIRPGAKTIESRRRQRRRRPEGDRRAGRRRLLRQARQHQAIKFKPVTSADAAVEKLEVSGVHNCCGQCTNTIKKAVSSVGGVSGTEHQIEGHRVHGRRQLQAGRADQGAAGRGVLCASEAVTGQRDSPLRTQKAQSFHGDSCRS